MKTLYLAPLLALYVLAAPLCLAADAKPDASTVTEVVALERQLGQASVSRDRAVLENLISQHFVCLSPSGRVLRKADIVNMWTSEDSDSKDAKFALEKPEVFDDAPNAIVVATTIDTWVEKGVVHTYRERVFDVWRKAGASWQLIASTSAKLDDSK